MKDADIKSAVLKRKETKQMNTGTVAYTYHITAKGWGGKKAGGS
jgi:hypothetical protein